MKPVREQLQEALDNEQDWKKALSHTDTGSYCESAGYDAKTTQPVVAAYAALADALLTYQRSGLTPKTQ